MNYLLDTPSRDRGTRRKSILTIALAVVALALVMLAQTSAGRKLTHDLGLYEPSEAYTEMYFSYPKQVALATEGATRTTPQRISVSFALHNEEHNPRTYQWTILVSGRPVAQGSVFDWTGAHVTVTRQVATGCSAVLRSAGAATGASRPTPARNAKRRRHGRGSARTRAANRGTASPSAAAPSPPPQIPITVKLAAPAQSISYWVSCRHA